MPAPSTTNAPIEIKLNGNVGVLKVLGNDRELITVITDLISKTQYRGTFTVFVHSTSRPRTGLGMHLGTIMVARNSIELIWCPKGSEAYVIQLSAPRGVEVIEFHKTIDEMLRERSNTDKKASQNKNGSLVEFSHSPVQAVSPTVEELKAVMVALCELSPDFGYVSLTASLETLTELVTHPKEMHTFLVEQGHLEPLPGSEETFRISAQWRGSKAPPPPPPPKPPITSTGLSEVRYASVGAKKTELDTADLLAEFERITRLAEQAEALRTTKASIDTELATIEAQIAPQLARIRVLQEQKAQIDTTLTSSEFMKASELVRTFKGLMKQSS